jgi:hypothetical protein
MSRTPPARERREPSPGAGLAATLWVVAALLVAFLLAWALFASIYAG